MKELWSVEFSLAMKDFVESDTPGIDGEILVKGDDIYEALEKARYRLNKLGYDDIIIHSAIRSGFEKKGTAK
jgi:hypothetical protein